MTYFGQFVVHATDSVPQFVNRCERVPFDGCTGVESVPARIPHPSDDLMELAVTVRERGPQLHSSPQRLELGFKRKLVRVRVGGKFDECAGGGSSNAQIAGFDSLQDRVDELLGDAQPFTSDDHEVRSDHNRQEFGGDRYWEEVVEEPVGC